MMYVIIPNFIKTHNLPEGWLSISLKNLGHTKRPNSELSNEKTQFKLKRRNTHHTLASCAVNTHLMQFAQQVRSQRSIWVREKNLVIIQLDPGITIRKYQI